MRTLVMSSHGLLRDSDFKPPASLLSLLVPLDSGDK
jgi:hypothetical protein